MLKNRFGNSNSTKQSINNFISQHTILVFILAFVFSLVVLYIYFLLQKDDVLDFLLTSIVVFGLLFILAINIADDKVVPKLFTLPTTIFLLLTTIAPTIYLLYISFFDVSLANFRKQWEFNGIENYIRVISDYVVLESFIRTCEYVVIAVGIELVLGLSLAMLLNWEFKGKKLFSLILVLPMMMTPIVVGMGWKYFFDFGNGFINILLSKIGYQPVPWLTSQPLAVAGSSGFLSNVLNLKWSFVSMVFVDIWQWTPFMLLVLLAGLSSLPHEPQEAAMIDGASEWQRFLYITLPQLRPTITVVVLIRIMDAIKAFDTIWALFGNAISTRTLNISIYTFGLGVKKFGQGAALSVLTLILVVILSKMFIKVMLGKEKELGN